MQSDFLSTIYKNTERIVALVDMDCFYVQVEQRLQTEYLGKPCVVVQYNQWKGGGIIAVNYEARAFGIERRGMRGNDAKRKCPDVHLFSVPVERGKANLTRYREAGAEVLEVMCQFSSCVERASIDEAYLDLTDEVNKRLKESPEIFINSNLLQNTFVVGWEKKQHLEETAPADMTDDREAGLVDWLNSSCSVNECDRKLAVAAAIVEKMRAAIYEKTTFRCSAGIAHNKVLAKLACGLHKPNRQTVLPQQSVPILFESLPVNKVRSLGGKLGEEIKEKFSIRTMGELAKIKESQLTKLFGEKNGSYLFQLGQGIEFEPVTPRQLPKSIGCGKNIHGNSRSCVEHWVNELSEELSERLMKDQQNNGRVAKHLSISLRSFRASFSRSCSLQSYECERIAQDVMQVLQKLNTAPPNSNDWHPILTNISLSASKFQDNLDLPAQHIKSFFTKSSPSKINPDISSKRLKLDNIENIDDIEVAVPLAAESPQSGHPRTTEQSDKFTGIKGFFAKKMEGMVSDGNSSSVYDSDSNSASNVSFFTKETELKLHTDKSKVMTSGNQFQDFDNTFSNKASTSCLSSTTENKGESQDEFTYKCDQCNKMVPLQDIEEHSDFHYAQKLSKELCNVTPSHTSRPGLTGRKPLSNQTKKKGRPRNVKTEKKKIDMKPLEFYMK